MTREHAPAGPAGAVDEAAEEADRWGLAWVLNAAGQWCEPLPTGVYPDELVEWAPLTRHLDGPGPRAPMMRTVSVGRAALPAPEPAAVGRTGPGGRTAMTEDEPVTDDDNSDGNGGDSRPFFGVRDRLRPGVTEALNALGAEHGCPPLVWNLRPNGTLNGIPNPPRLPGDGPPALLDEWTLTGWIGAVRPDAVAVAGRQRAAAVGRRDRGGQPGRAGHDRRPGTVPPLLRRPVTTRTASTADWPRCSPRQQCRCPVVNSAGRDRTGGRGAQQR